MIMIRLFEMYRRKLWYYILACLISFLILFIDFWHEQKEDRASRIVSSCNLSLLSSQVTSNNVTARVILQEYCQGDERIHCVPPFQKFEKRFRLSTKYRLNLCAIEKNFSTILTAIICFLFDEDKFRKKNREFGKETFARRLCARQNEAFSFDHISTKYNISEADLNNWVHFAAIREPIDRFVSGFVDKCLVERTWIQYKERCNGCMTNLTCFVDAEYDRMLRFSKEKARLNSFDDRHFFPQNWRCQFYSHFRHFIFLDYSSTPEKFAGFFENFYKLLRKQYVPENDIKFIGEQVIQGRTEHSTFNLSQRNEIDRYVRSNAYIMSKLIKMYYFDFVLFGYPLPKMP